MQERTLNSIKSKVGWVLFACVAYLTNLALVPFSKPWPSFEFVAWIVIAGIISFLQVLSIITIKNNSKSPKWIRRSIVSIITYVLTTIITFSGSIMFSGRSIDARIQHSITITNERENKIRDLEKDIAKWETNNQTYEATIKSYLEKNQVSSTERLEKLIKVNEDKIEKARKDIETVKLSATNVKEEGQVSANTFDEAAKMVPFIETGEQYKKLIKFILSLLLEFGLFTTLEATSKFTLDRTETKKELTKYINALFDVTGERLNSDKKIEEITKIPLSKCLKYKQFLQENTYNDKPLIVSGRGGTKANFPKDDMLHIITFLLNTNKI